MPRLGVEIIVSHNEQVGIGVNQVIYYAFDAPVRVNQHRHGAGQNGAPEGHIPIGAVLAEDGHFVADLNLSGANKPQGESPRGGPDPAERQYLAAFRPDYFEARPVEPFDRLERAVEKLD
jgi:hypothetical protein